MKMKKILALALAAVLLVAVSVAGTMAWLMDTSDKITNTFTPTSLEVDVDENTGDSYVMVPGAEIEKDPFVTYTTDVPAWLFVKVTESENLKDFISYEIDDDNWTQVPGVAGVYYCTVSAGSSAEGGIAVIADDTVTVKTEVTKAMMDELTANPTLAFDAYIIQQTAATSAEAAWALVSGN